MYLPAPQAHSGAHEDKANWAELLDWRCVEDSDVPLYQQVSDFLRDRIVTGLIPPGSRLPSTRQLMDRLGVSRTTVITAYSQLTADGYLVCRVGSGTYVADEVGETINVPARSFAEPAAPAPVMPGLVLSARGRRYQEMELDQLVKENIPFNTGMVRIDGRASVQWQHIVRHLLAVQSVYQGYGNPQGSLAIRQEVARYVAVSRGIRCTPDQVILVAGSQQAIDLAIKVLLDPGVSAWVEEPGYPLTRVALQTAGVNPCAIPVDGEGLRVQDGVERCPNARAVFVTPSHQYPLGVALSLRRRNELLAWAAARGAWVVEDDYDSEFRYGGPVLPALKGLDRSDRVVYVGSFSKVLLPGIRYGYLVVPPSLTKAFVAARFLADRQSPVFFEDVLAEFIKRGYFVSHIRRMRSEYSRARDALVGMLRERAAHLLDVTAPDQGLHLIVYLKHGIPDTIAAERAAHAGVVVRPISRLYSGDAPRSGLMLGFAGFAEARMKTAVDRLATVLESLASNVRAS